MTEPGSGSGFSNPETKKPETAKLQPEHTPGETDGGSGPNGADDGKTSARSSSLLWGLAAVGALVSLYFLCEIGPIDQRLKAVGTGKGILGLELAFTSERAAEILSGWPDDPAAGANALPELAKRSLKLDFGLIVGYCLLLTSLYLLVRKVIREAEPGVLKIDPAFFWWGRFGWGAKAHELSKIVRTKTAYHRWTELTLLPVVAGLCDAGENMLLLEILGPDPFSSAMIGFASLLASVKFLLLTVATIPLLVIAIVRGRRFLQKKLPGQVDRSKFVTPDTVIQGERDYLGKRRKMAGISTAEIMTDEPIGVALSGGGIRSATLNLGALEALIRLRVLPRVDYLSTVSGGGYIGSLLSSLLSINSKHYDDVPVDINEQYRFAAGDRAKFTTRPQETPFHSEQLSHLRTHGDFLILRHRLIHRDVLRVVATILGGIFYHVLMFLAVLTVLAGLYLGVSQWMAGPFSKIESAIIVSEPSAEQVDASAEESKSKADKSPNLFFRYLSVLLEPITTVEHPFWTAAVAGLVIVPLSMIIISWILWGSSLPDAWFVRRSESVEENREYQSLWALFWIALVAATSVTVSAVLNEPVGQASFLLLPMGIYVGGWLASLVLHAVVSTAPIFDRNARSRFAAWKGIFHYFTLASVIALMFPLAILWFSTRDGFTFRTGGLVWLASAAATWLFSKKETEKSGAAEAKKIFKKLAGMSASLRNFFLGLAVAVLIGGGLLLISAVIYDASVDGGHEPVGFSFLVALGAALLVLFLGFVLDFNRLALHYFYRDRLVETYLQTLGASSGTGSGIHYNRGECLRLHRDNSEMRLQDLHGSPQEGTGERGMLGEYFKRALWSREGSTGGEPELPTCVTASPYHLVVSCLNLTQSRDLKRRNRKSDHFIFSKLYCGSDTTGYVDTRYYRSGATGLARAVAISGAAVSPAIGSGTFFAQSFATSLFNLRLGQWLENPSYRGGARAHARENLVFWPIYLLKEMLGSTNADSRLVYLSDGAHTGDNVGIVPLLKRRCRLILAFDAECDPEHLFGSLTEAIRQVSIDEEVEIDIDLTPIYGEGPGKSKRHVAVGRIDYPDGKTGWLLVFKSSLTGDEPETIKTYARTHSSFPNQSTADLFFDDAQFEAYRRLGDHQVSMGLGEELGAALDAKAEWRAAWETDFPDLAAMGIPA